MTKVDQQKIRRVRTGLIAHDPALAQPGFTLFAPMYGDGSVFLIDMEGEVAHRWAMPYRPGLYAYLLDSGYLFYGGKVMDDLDRFEAWPRFKAGAALEVDWNGRVAWELKHPDHHHDARKLRNGNVLLLCLRPLADDIARQVKGGLPGTEADGKIYADYLLEMTTAGQVVWEWRSWEHLDPETHPITLQDHRAEWTHGNTVAETADGNILVSFRNISTVVMIERATGNIIWELGSPPLAQQHDPRPLPNGNVLIFDNGMHRPDHPRHLLAGDRGRSPQQRDCLGIPRPVAIRVLQPLHLRRAAAGKRQYLDLRGRARPHLRGDPRRRGRLGIRQPVFFPRTWPPRPQ